MAWIGKDCECASPAICCWGSFPHHKGGGGRAGLGLSLLPLRLLRVGLLLLYELQEGTRVSVNLTWFDETV
jgi:hypothetical protein